MKKLLAILLVLVVLVSSLISCDILAGLGNGGDTSDNGNGGDTSDNGNGTGTEKRVPVYQGMTIESASGVAYIGRINDKAYKNNNGNGNDNGNDGNHYGNNKNPGDYDGDYDGKDESVDVENPYPDNDSNENIETEISSSLKVQGPLHDMYYAAPNQDIYIFIHIDNPDSFEIMSFTLNGKKYSSYMFEDGSDMETIILKYNVGDVSGIVEYTIDAIKYIDGTEIKDVLIDGDQTVRVGVKTENQVYATVSNLNVGTNSISFNANIKDNDNLVEYFKGSFYAVLYDGDEIVAKQELSVGDNSVLFDNLDTNSLYQYAIVGYYDDLSGSGFGMHVLHKNALYTESVVLFDNIVIGQDSISFTLLWHKDHQGKSLTSLTLWKDGNVVSQLNVNDTSVGSLLSANSYSLVAEYQNGDETETIYLDFATFEKGVPGINLIVDSVAQAYVSFSIVEIDEENVGNISKIELVNNNGTVVATSLDAREFTNLLSDNRYTIRVSYVYNLNDGNGDHVIIKEASVTTLKKATPTISILNTGVNQDSISFEISEEDTDGVGSITKIELVHKDGTIVADSTDAREFKNLLSNNEYTVRVSYVYDLNDGNGDHVITKEASVTTLKKATPEISVVSPTKTQTSVGFEISETDADNIGTVTKIELVHANGTVVADSLDQRTFANLLSNNAYTVKVTYVYNLGDGEGEHTVTKELAITTLAKAVPSFIVKNENITADSVTAEYDVIDVDNILSYYKVELYKDDTLVMENSDKAIDFTGLDYYTDYTVKISYTYDLNDGNGNQTATYSYAFKTLPYIDVTECNIANTSAVSEGETIFMSVKMDNPLGMTIESVVINGETYNVTGASTKNKIFVEIVYNGQFAGGDTYLKVDKVNAKIDNTTLSVEPKSEISDNVFINGKLEVLKIEFVNDRFEPIDWAFPSDTIYVMITLNNPTGYNVDCVNGNITNIFKFDNNHWYYDANAYMNNGWCMSTLDSLSYSNKHISKVVSYSDMRIWYYITTTNETIYIRNANDLKNMSGGCYYELANDIDLSGMEWVGEDFSGVFDGKGYAIKNMSFVSNIKNSNAYLGLFSYGTGVIQNLNIEDATIIADVTTSDEGEYKLYCGGLIAYSHLIKINNCEIDDTSVINIKTDSRTSYVGGLIGYIAHETDAFLSNCINGSSISLKSNKSQVQLFAGGLIGGINNTGYVLYSNYFINIINCINTGDISAYFEGVEWYQSGAGTLVGIVGMLNDSSKLIVNSLGNLNTGDTSHQFIGDTIYDYCIFINTYSLHSIDPETLCTIEQLNSKEFYTDVLGWSEGVWDLTSLDVENGQYPKLK